MNFMIKLNFTALNLTSSGAIVIVQLSVDLGSYLCNQGNNVITLQSVSSCSGSFTLESETSAIYQLQKVKLYSKIKYTTFENFNDVKQNLKKLSISLQSKLLVPPHQMGCGANKNEINVLLVGLDATGKTRLLNKLVSNSLDNTCPTIEPMKQVLTYKKKQLHVTDLGGQDEQRAKWSEHFQNVHAVVFVVDSHDLDPERLQLAASELKKIMETLNAKLLILANKMDLPRAINAKEITEHLQLNSIQKQWAIQECCAVSGEGLYEGLDKLLQMLK
ncbi:ADP-ribosylation_factor [Hexamita inflata]|uniref:ADP-ribosylation factor n=1 Tax=Hexamita inflata TaxID=28002 RepID=A0AA86PWV1_9EUKA|nr:ADP-ribosylation factor [Hexamita inflata]